MRRDSNERHRRERRRPGEVDRPGSYDTDSAPEVGGHRPRVEDGAAGTGLPAHEVVGNVARDHVVQRIRRLSAWHAPSYPRR